MGRRAVTAGLALLYVGLWAIASLVLKTTPSDLDYFFWPSSETVLAGHPLLIYASHAHDAYPNANGPLGLVPLVPIAALANVLSWAGNLGARAALAGAMASIFIMVLGYQAVRLIARGRGVLEWRLAAASTMLLAPAIWIAVLDYGHVEQPVELCLILFAASCSLSDRWVRCGVALGAAMLTRTTAALCMIPFLLMPFVTRRVAPATSAVIAAVVTVVVGLLPFVIADEPAVVHSLLAYRSSLPIGGGSFWILARQTSWADLGRYGDVYITVVAAAVLVGVILWLRRAAAMTPAGLLGLLTVATACFPLFAKTVFPYYLVEPYVCAAVWWLARPGSARNWRALVPLLLTAAVVLGQAETALPGLGLALAEGVVSSVCMAAVIALVTADLVRTPVQITFERKTQAGASVP